MLFRSGANKECGGYQEMQENLPRWQSLSINRQVVYDETFTETPTQAWQFAPLVDYHGGSNAALEPVNIYIYIYIDYICIYIFEKNNLFQPPPERAPETVVLFMVSL